MIYVKSNEMNATVILAQIIRKLVSWSGRNARIVPICTIIALIGMMLALAGCAGEGQGAKTPPQAVAGVLDLRDWD